jgi:uncharacterized membrane protein
MDKLRGLAYFSLVYGGFLVIAYSTVVYNSIWHQEFTPNVQFNRTEAFNSSVLPSPFPADRPFRDRGLESIRANPLSQILALQNLAILLTGMAFLINGYVLFKYLQEKDKKETKKFVIRTLLSDDEKQVYEYLIKNGGESTQKQISLNTGFSAVQTYRLLQRLESKKVVKSFPFGMTKKIVINQDVGEKK